MSSSHSFSLTAATKPSIILQALDETFNGSRGSVDEMQATIAPETNKFEAVDELLRDIG